MSAFQEANGLPATGVADKGTLGILAQQAAQQIQSHAPAHALRPDRNETSLSGVAPPLNPEHTSHPISKPAGSIPLLSDPDHSHHSFFRQMLDKVHAAETQRGISPGIHSERLAGTLSVEGIRNGLTSVDRIELSHDGSLARAVQISATRDETALNRSTPPVNTAQAVNQTLQVSSEQAQEAVAIERSRAAMEQTQQQNQARGSASMMA
ncbi:peptidoglycan-binding protein [Xanthomonas prunicola]|uniref:Peptidoglycan-binding protein n=1 Tax=Xanthomonas prunicola TaxID=2053930 RepID=A0A9Q9MMW5_9XANT|nr:peptidoglycan-binding domain-containing protein [Xanthomonas prunicola]USJ02505.1 peptidoglycan-binding protein [Xanthomonas prunicola]UXA47030.1 peptidoglycan-binding protein [Xanthomonas prunicola]UXA55500.1 peptidoglycan-binding protein [Xanthomonas prunicola]UXA61472.1 peptidoglycan-binding protein [Xanthomonas prunicola]UXA63687.1 peptidoglycan-binding protein [Xanthomonas prunicola]